MNKSNSGTKKKYTNNNKWKQKRPLGFLKNKHQIYHDIIILNLLISI